MASVSRHPTKTRRHTSCSMPPTPPCWLAITARQTGSLISSEASTAAPPRYIGLPTAGIRVSRASSVMTVFCAMSSRMDTVRSREASRADAAACTASPDAPAASAAACMRGETARCRPSCACGTVVALWDGASQGLYAVAAPAAPQSRRPAPSCGAGAGSSRAPEPAKSSASGGSSARRRGADRGCLIVGVGTPRPSPQRSAPERVAGRRRPAGRTRGRARGGSAAVRQSQMVNPGKVLKARKSKRQSLHDKHKIAKKVREHQRKIRRDAKRGIVKGRKKKDPGIPNSWPFKAQLIEEQRAQREAQVLAMADAREAKKRERAAARAADDALQRASQTAARGRRDAKRKAAAFLPLHDVLADAALVLLLLDARDPLACRCEALEAALRECDKPYALVLTKADLVPAANLTAWLGWLGGRAPALAVAAEAADAAVGLAPLLALLEAATASAGGRDLTVGLVGFDGVGKRSLLRSARALTEAGGPALSRVAWLAKPARLQPLSTSLGVNDVLLRKATAEAVPQPEMAAAAVVERCDRRALLKHLQIAAFGTDEEFLARFAARVGAETPRAAAVAALRHWARGEMPFFTRVAEDETPTGEEQAAAAAAVALLGVAATKAVVRAARGVAALARAEPEGCVALAAGEAEEIDLSAEEEWGEADAAGVGGGEESGEEGEEESGEDGSGEEGEEESGEEGSEEVEGEEEEEDAE
eukprot:scaffold12132_cov103-Isochrysis_galbana.AAC.8